MGQKMEIKCYKWFGSHARDVEVSSGFERNVNMRHYTFTYVCVCVCVFTG